MGVGQTNNPWYKWVLYILSTKFGYEDLKFIKSIFNGIHSCHTNLPPDTGDFLHVIRTQRYTCVIHLCPVNYTPILSHCSSRLAVATTYGMIWWLPVSSLFRSDFVQVPTVARFDFVRAPVVDLFNYVHVPTVARFNFVQVPTVARCQASRRPPTSAFTIYLPCRHCRICAEPSFSSTCLQVECRFCHFPTKFWTF